MNSEKGWYKMKKVLMLLGAVMISVLAVGCTSEKKKMRDMKLSVKKKKR